MANEERLRELEEKYEGYTVYDNQGSKIGKVDDLFVDESDNEEYIGVKMGFLGTKSTLIPTEVVRVNEQDRSIEVSESKDHVKDAPSFSDDDDITSDYEERIRGHFGLGSTGSSDRGSYGGESSGAAATGGAAASSTPGMETGGSSATDREQESSGYETSSGEDRGESSGGDTGYGGRSGSTTETTGGDRGTGEYGDQTTSSSEETHREEAAATGGAAGGTTDRDQHQESDTTSEQQDTSSTGTSGQESSTTGRPSTSRQTEETETFQEGGRTKIRRRTIIEEVVDADEQ